MSDAMMNGRTPPHSAEAEQSVLGALLIDNRVFDAVGDILSGERFYFPVHAAIYSTIAKLVVAGKPADVVTVYEAGGHELQLLNSLAAAVPSSRNARRYAELVAEHWLRREMQRVALDLVDELADASAGARPVAEVADAAAGKLLGLCSGLSAAQEPQWVGDVVPAFIDLINDMAEGKLRTVLTGLRDVDEATGGGGRPGELWVLGGRPSMGKSALVQSVALNVSRMHGVLMLTQEDSMSTWLSRAVANLGRVNLADIRNPARARNADAMWSGVAAGVDQLPAHRLLLDDQGGLTLADVRRKAKQAKRKLGGGLDLLIEIGRAHV